MNTSKGNDMDAGDRSAVAEANSVFDHFHTAQESAEALAVAIGYYVNRRLEKSSVCSLAFSGGSTPAAMLQCLAQQNVDWSRVQVTLVDERCVDASHPRSNARMLTECFTSQLKSNPEFFPLYVSGESTLDRKDRLAKLALPFDLVHLGMGEDAHTASFFPDADNVEEMLDMGQPESILETRSVASQEERLTWSLATVANAKRLILQINGSGKREVLAQAFAKMDVQSVGSEKQLLRREMPIVAVLERCQLSSPALDGAGLAQWLSLPDDNLKKPLTVYYAEQ